MPSAALVDTLLEGSKPQSLSAYVFDGSASLEFYGENSSDPLEHNEISDETLELIEQVRVDDHEPYGEHLNIEGYANGPIGDAEPLYNEHVPLDDGGL